MIQITLIQLDNYGPWTVSPKPRPEAELQILQSEIFSEVEREFRKRHGLVFQTRYDNMLAVTNGVSLGDHQKILKRINRKFPVTVSMGVGVARTAYDAQKKATMFLQQAGSSRSPDRTGMLVGKALRSISDGWVQLTHIDINHSTALTDTEPIYDTHFYIQQTYLMLMKFLLKKKSLVFYTGGDNFMAPSNGLSVADFSKVFSRIRKELDVGLKAGVGLARTAERAAHLASEGLHEIREGKVGASIVFKRD